MLVEALQEILSNDSGVVTLLGSPTVRSDSTTGVFPVQAPDQPTMPYVVLQQAGGAPLQESMAGTGALTGERWRMTAHGATYRQAKKLAKAIMQAMISANGVTVAGEAFLQGVWKRMEADEAESIGRGTMFSSHQDFEILYVDLDV